MVPLTCAGLTGGGGGGVGDVGWTYTHGGFWSLLLNM